MKPTIKAQLAELARLRDAFRRGGQATSKRKAAASRANGRRGGRPRTSTRGIDRKGAR